MSTMRAFAVRAGKTARSAGQVAAGPSAATGFARPGGHCPCGGSCPHCRAAGPQRKPMVSTPGDRWEREAETMADRVVPITPPQAFGTAPDMLQRSCLACDAEEQPSVQLDASPGAQALLNPDAAWQAAASGGAPLSGDLRAYFEPRFGHDFSGVRVHHDNDAAHGARAIQARAYTIGRDIVFGAGEFQPETPGGTRLLAHELTHVVQQQSGGMTGMPVQRQVDPAAPAEPAAVPGPTLLMAKPPHFPQGPLTCWASAIASWNRVKGLVASNVTDQTLINHYRGTDCIDASDALIGDTNADVEAVFGEWRLLLNLSAEIPDLDWTFEFVKSLIEGHGHFVVVTGDISLMHAMVVYGVRLDDKNDRSQFTVFVEDPIAPDNERAGMLMERPIRVGLGTGKSSGPAPCRSRPPRP